jgi:hypothetical protein
LPRTISRTTCTSFQRPDDVGTYLSINWWEGNLRPYESLTLFVIRFCDLNGTTPAQCCEYLGLADEYSIPSDADMERIAVVLNENLTVVRTVFEPSITLGDCGRYCPPQSEAHPSIVRYCEACAVHGYHSYLHEIHWLLKCPFHMCDLKRCPETRYTGAAAVRRRSALKHVMQKNWSKWPRAADTPFTLHEGGVLGRLEEWVLSASGAARRLSKGQIWHSGEGEFIAEKSLGQAIGRLRTLTPMPREIEPIFTDIGETWELHTYRFPMPCKEELKRIEPHFGFSSIFDLYKKVSAWSAVQPAFVVQRLRTQEAIKKRHGTCHCSWGKVINGWSYHWENVNPEDSPHWGSTCPYDVAVEELERRWGRAELVLSRRHAENALFYFISQSYAMHSLELIVYTKDAKLSSEGQLYAYPQVWPCCEWASESPLAALLDLAGSFEVETVADSLWNWLNAIDTGASPRGRVESTSCLRLCEEEDGLVLINWSRTGAGMDIRHRSWGCHPAFKRWCVFHRNWTPVPPQTGQAFQRKLDTCSTPNWTPWA